MVHLRLQRSVTGMQTCFKGIFRPLPVRRRDQGVQVKPDEVARRAQQAFIGDRQGTLGFPLNQMGQGEIKKLAHV
jgi:hypothetical protein